jgi:hypothetical protein
LFGVVGFLVSVFLLGLFSGFRVLAVCLFVGGWLFGLGGEFDPGSGRTLAACLTHASRAERPLLGVLERRTGE